MEKPHAKKFRRATGLRAKCLSPGHLGYGSLENWLFFAPTRLPAGFGAAHVLPQRVPWNLLKNRLASPGARTKIITHPYLFPAATAASPRISFRPQQRQPGLQIPPSASPPPHLFPAARAPTGLANPTLGQIPPNLFPATTTPTGLANPTLGHAPRIRSPAAKAPTGLTSAISPPDFISGRSRAHRGPRAARPDPEATQDDAEGAQEVQK